MDRLAREVGPAVAAGRSATSLEDTAPHEDWVISETTSPLDYSPVLVATSIRDLAAGSGMKLSIACRGGTTSLVLGSRGGLAAGDRYVVWYTINDGPAKPLPATMTPSGLALNGDVVGLLSSLPAMGEIGFRIVGRHDVLVEGRYSLAGLTLMRERMANPCRWPPRTDAPRK